MSDAALLAAIRAAPADDAPRLVYADWLDENGQPERAEFIRVQCERDRTDRHGDRWFDLDNRATELRNQHFGRWREPLRALQVQGEFRRGFVEPMYLPITTYIDRHAELTALEPAVDVKFSVTPAVNLAKRAASPTLGLLRDVSFDDSFVKWDRLRGFLASPHLTRLERLSLGRCGLRAPQLAAFFRLTNLTGLRELSLADNPVGVGVREFSDPRNEDAVSRLESLGLDGCQIPARAAEDLCRAPFRSLKVLRLTGNILGEFLPDAFGDWAGELRQLWLSDPLSDAAFESLFRPGRFRSLQTLNLGGCGPYSAARLALLSDPARFPALKALDLHDIVAVDPTPAGPGDVRGFLESPVVAGLQSLTMSPDRVWAEAFTGCQAGRGLRQLVLSEASGAGPEDLRAILCSSGLNELRELVLWRPTDAVLRDVATSPNLPSLKRLRAGHRGHYTPETLAAWENRCGPAIWH